MGRYGKTKRQFLYFWMPTYKSFYMKVEVTNANSTRAAYL